MQIIRDLKKQIESLKTFSEALADLVEAQGKQIDQLNAEMALEKAKTHETKRPYRRRNSSEDRGSGTEQLRDQ